MDRVGAQMKDLSAREMEELGAMLREFAGFGKAAAPGEVLATRIAPAEEVALAWDKDGFRRIVRAADFMAACGPDNAGRPWVPARLELASRLRTLFFERFRENAYDG
jgi:hypothetical protein